jgi:hypothetical protein
MAGSGGAVPAPALPAASCAGGFGAEVDRASFTAPDAAPSAPELEALRESAEALVQRVAGRMCAAGELRGEALRPVRRLVVQQGAGADDVVFFAEEGRADGLVFQFVFDGVGEGAGLGLPDEGDVREGLLCWADGDAYREMCEGRLP